MDLDELLRAEASASGTDAVVGEGNWAGDNGAQDVGVGETTWSLMEGIETAEYTKKRKSEDDEESGDRKEGVDLESTMHKTAISSSTRTGGWMNPQARKRRRSGKLGREMKKESKSPRTHKTSLTRSRHVPHPWPSRQFSTTTPSQTNTSPVRSSKPRSPTTLWQKDGEPQKGPTGCGCAI